MPVQLLIAANDCTDGTVERMREYQTPQAERGRIPLQVIEVPMPGKSQALNRGIPEIDTDLAAFVYDHRVDEIYLVAIEEAADAWPDAGLFCARILPDWDGSER